MGKQNAPLGRLYMDSLGDPGRSQGSLPTYAVCTIWVQHSEDALEQMFAEIRQSLGLRADYEFHARQLTSLNWAAEMPQKFFQLLIDQNLQLECWCAEVQKSRSDLPLHIAGKALTHHLMGQTLMRMPIDVVRGQTLVIDEEAKGKKVPKVIDDMRKALKQQHEAEEREYTLRKISAHPAHRKAGLQLADFMAAALVVPWASCTKQINHWPIHHWRT